MAVDRTLPSRIAGTPSSCLRKLTQVPGEYMGDDRSTLVRPPDHFWGGLFFRRIRSKCRRAQNHGEDGRLARQPPSSLNPARCFSHGLHGNFSLPHDSFWSVSSLAGRRTIYDSSPTPLPMTCQEQCSGKVFGSRDVQPKHGTNATCCGEKSILFEAG